MSVILDNNIIVDMASTHKVEDVEYCHIIFKILSCENPVYVDFRCNKQSNKNFEYFWSTEVLCKNEKEHRKYELRSCFFEQYVKEMDFNNKTKNTYNILDNQYSDVLANVRELIVKNNSSLLFKLFKEQERLLQLKTSLSDYPEFAVEILSNTNEKRSSLLNKQ